MVAGGVTHSVFVDARGGVLTCGSEPSYLPGALGHGALSDPMIVAVPTVVAALQGGGGGCVLACLCAPPSRVAARKRPSEALPKSNWRN